MSLNNYYVYNFVLFYIFILCNTSHCQTWQQSNENSGIFNQFLYASSSVTTPAIPGNNKSSSGSIAISYFNPSLPAMIWTFPAQYTPLVVAALAERMTLPTNSGYVDSVSIRIDSISSSGKIGVLLFPDTLFRVADGRLFHLPNIFDTKAQAFATKIVDVSSIRTGGFTTIPFDHIRVPNEFFVIVNSQVQGTVMKFVGDDGPIHPRTTENTRSVFVAVNQNQQVLTALLDSTFIINNRIRYSHLYMIAYVDTSNTTNTVETSPLPAFVDINICPNPVALKATIQIQDPLLINKTSTRSLILYDLLGREVRDFRYGVNDSNTSSITFNVTALPSGMYILKYQNSISTVTKMLSIVK